MTPADFLFWAFTLACVVVFPLLFITLRTDDLFARALFYAKYGGGNPIPPTWRDRRFWGLEEDNSQWPIR